jgi:ubiquinone/menaquinone biosynthesis C-methylase UbiE
VLDLGCGDGYLMSLLSPSAQSVTGIDPEPTAVALASRKLAHCGNCVVRIGSCYDLEFPDNSFDAVVMADMIEHLDDDDRCLQEASRVLSLDGTVIVTTPRRRVDRAIQPEHVREYAARDLAEVMRRWFRDVEMVGLWPLMWSKLYHTRIGWRAIKVFARHCGNPFDREGPDTERFAMLLAVGRRPRKRPAH